MKLKNWIIWLSIFIVVPIPLVLALGESGEHLLTIGSGVVAYVWFLLEIFISIRPKMIERMVGLPEMYAVHGIMAVGAIALSYFHKLVTHAEGWVLLFGDWSLYLYIGLAIFSFFTFSDLVTQYIPILEKLKQFISKNLISREFNLWIHRLNVIATVFAFLHVLLCPSMWSAGNGLFMPLFFLYTGLTFALYLNDKLLQPLFYPKFKVSNVINLNDNTVQVDLTQQSGEPFSYQAGQYVFASFKDPKFSHEYHPFSLVSSPDSTKNIISLGIKKLGDLTNQMDQLSPGSIVKISGPYGILSKDIDRDTKNTIIFVAGGIGITPILSTIKSLPKQAKIYLFWSVKYQKDLVYDTEINTLQRNYPNFKYFPIITRENIPNYETGHLNKDKLERILSNEDLINGTVIMCGPTRMMTTLAKDFKQLGVPAGRIRYEKFSF